MAIRTFSANIPTQLPPGNAKIEKSLTTESLPMPRIIRIAAIALSVCLFLTGSIDASSQPQHHRRKSTRPKPIPCPAGCTPETGAPEITSAAPDDQAAQHELSSLARELRNATPGSYQRLADFAKTNAGNVWGARAALALGFDDYNKNHPAQALAWFIKAQPDTLLSEYVLFYTAQVQRTLKRNKDALAALQTVNAEHPGTALKEQLLEALGPLAIDMGHPQVAVDALEAYPSTVSKPPLLLIRAQAYRAVRQFGRAAKDYQALFYKFPLSDEAKVAGSALPQMMKALGKEYPYPGVELQEQRAQAFFDGHKWREARSEFEKLLTMLRDSENPHRQLAQLRVAEARVQQKSSPSLVSSLALADFEVDAERLYELSQIYRNDKKEGEMLSAIEQLVKKYPTSKWTQEALMAGGNYFWVELDRNKAASYYQRVLDNFPDGKYEFNCQWRVAWVAYLNRQPNAEEKLTAFLRKYPVSANSPDVLYWLGRIAERNNSLPHARAYFRAAAERFPETYFGQHAAGQLDKLAPGEADPPEILAAIPPAPPLRPFDEPIPANVMERWLRAQALRTIAFDAAAELELKSAYYAAGCTRLLFEAAQAAFDQGHFAAGMAYGRLIVPNFDSRRFSDVPLIVWRTLYPLPYEAALRREAARNNFDPMLAAGLIRQESTFQADAVSPKAAVGLMQVLPKTGKLMAKNLKVHYGKTKLYEPDFNLEVGMVYVAGLLRHMGAPEYALAAFNAGEDRIAAWRAERQYEEIPELVESIPFTETREYVEIVLRNAEVYRRIYGASPPVGPTPPPVTTVATKSGQ
jgi:soluble lytic murein transglycosylase